MDLFGIDSETEYDIRDNWANAMSTSFECLNHIKNTN